MEEVDIYKLRLQMEGVPCQYWSTEQLAAYRDGLKAYTKGDERMFRVGPMASRERAITNELQRRSRLPQPEPEIESEPVPVPESELHVAKTAAYDTHPTRQVLFGFAMFGMLLGGLGLYVLLA